MQVLGQIKAVAKVLISKETDGNAAAGCPKIWLSPSDFFDKSVVRSDLTPTDRSFTDDSFVRLNASSVTSVRTNRYGPYWRR